MKTIGLTVVVGLISGIVGVAVGSDFFTEYEEPLIESGIDRRVSALESRLVELESTGTSSTPRRSGDSMSAIRAEIAALRARVDGESRPDRPVVATPSAEEITDAVTEVIDQRIAVDREKRQLAAADRRKTQAREKTRAAAGRQSRAVAKALSLSPGQTERLQVALQEHMTLNSSEWGVLKNEGASREDRLLSVGRLRENIARLRTGLGGFLTESQIGQYEALDGKANPLQLPWLDDYEATLRENR